MRHLDHAAGVPCSICDAERRASNEELQELYTAIERIGLRPIDVVRQKRIEGKALRFLSELTSAEVTQLVKDCEAWEKRHGARNR